MSDSGDPVSNATVEIVGVDDSKINTTAPGQTKEQRAKELLEQSSNPLPSSWNPDLSISGSDGLGNNAGAEYVAVHRPEDWATPGWVSTIDLGDPTINPPAEEPITFSAWSPSKGEGALTIENTVDDDLPGATVRRDIVVERLDPLGDVVDRQTLEPNRELTTGIGPGERTHAYVTTTLPAGVYRVYPEGAENTAYTIVVGNVDDLRSTFATQLETRSDRLTKAAEDIQEKFDSGKFIRVTATTNESGVYTGDVPSNVDTVAVSAYKIDGEVLTSLENPTPQDMRAYVKNADYNGSVSMTLEPRRYSSPTQDADVTVRKFSTPPFPLLDDFATKWSAFRDQLENGTLTDLGSVYDVDLSEWDETELENGAKNLSKILESNNDELIDKWEDETGKDFEKFKDELEDSERTNEELRDDIRSMEEVIDSLKEQLEAEDPETSFNNGSVTFRQVFDGDFERDDVVATWYDYNGSTQPIGDEYVSVNKRTGLADEVVVEDYPVPEASSGGSIGVLVVDEDGKIGRGREQITNPGFGGTVPSLRSIDVSSLQPGAGETVSLDPKIDTAGVALESAKVYDGDGSSINATVSDGEVTFEPTKTGTHFVELTLNGSSDGGPYVETVRVPVRETSRDYPESVRVKEGRLGVYAIAGDEVDDAKVKLSENGRQVDVTAMVKPEQGTNEVHVYLEQAPTATDQEITTRVVAGSSIDTATSISRHVGVYIHGREITRDAVVYRSGSGVDVSTLPIPPEGETRGGVRQEGKQGGTVIKSYTSKNGASTIEINNDPGTFESLRFELDVWIENRDIPFAVVTPTSATASTTAIPSILATLVETADKLVDVASDGVVSNQMGAIA